MSQPRTAGIGAASPSGAPAVHPSRVAHAYERHRPDETLLYKTLHAHWRTFLSDLDSDGDSSALPAFVVSEVEAFLRCGILAHGFVLARCPDCGWSRAVGFSCQRRGFWCPWPGLSAPDAQQRVIGCLLRLFRTSAGTNRGSRWPARAQTASALLSIGRAPVHSRVHDSNPLEQTFICLGASAYGPLARGKPIAGAATDCDGDAMLAAFGMG